MTMARRHFTRRQFLGAASTSAAVALCGRTVPCFFRASEKDYGIHRKASDGEYAVYDLMPNAMDHFGIWENNTDRYHAAGGWDFFARNMRW